MCARDIAQSLLFRVISVAFRSIYKEVYCGIVSQLSRKVAFGKGFTVYKLNFTLFSLNQSACSSCGPSSVQYQAACDFFRAK